jgi:hypothetical protein
MDWGDEERIEIQAMVRASDAWLAKLVDAGLAAGYLTPEEAAILRGEDGPELSRLALSIRSRSDT